MPRAGVFIGVDKTGTLQQLHDAASGAERMHAWALTQSIADKTHAKLITDAGGKSVTPDLIYDAILELIDGPGVDQLIVYFAGHGVNINRNEHWLLSDAPRRANAAVNVTGSVELARYCGIPHIVMISDACRVAPEGIQAQNVRGVDIFPNEGAGDKAKPVDQFFACALGRTAAEIKDPAVAAGNYSALYTTALLDALSGKVPEILEPGASPADRARYLKPLGLESYLEAELPRRVKKAGLEKKVNQNPDALILNHPNWLARIEQASGLESVGNWKPHLPLESLRGITLELVRKAALNDSLGLDLQLDLAKDAGVAEAKEMAESTKQLAVPFGPDHYESNCGIKIRGAKLVDYYSPRIQAEFLSNDGDLLRVNTLENDRAASILLRFEGDIGTVIPVIPGFLASLSFADGELVDVAYEPSTNSRYWHDFGHAAPVVRAMRAVAAASSRHGRFRLEGNDAKELARLMQFTKGTSPSLAVYAAYAYHDLQEIERLREMADYQRNDIGTTFFDLALLGRRLTNKSIRPDDRIVPFTPLLSQGWALLGANRVKLHPALDGVEQTMRPSLWSLFDATGSNQIKKAMQTREVR